MIREDMLVVEKNDVSMISITYLFSEIISKFFKHVNTVTFITLVSMKSSVTSVRAGSGHVITLFSTDAVTTACVTFQAVLISVTFYYKSINVKELLIGLLCLYMYEFVYEFVLFFFDMHDFLVL